MCVDAGRSGVRLIWQDPSGQETKTSGRMLASWETPPTIIWDFNGTLIDDLRACLDALNAILRFHQIPPLTVQDYRQRFDFPVAAFYESLGMVPKTPYDWEALSESFHIRYLFSRHLALQPGAQEAVAHFRQQGFRQGVLSALEQGLLEMQLAQFGLSESMDFVLGSNNYHGASKTQAAQRLQLKGPVLLIGDTLHDAEVARAQGWDCLLCTAGHQAAERLVQARVPMIDTLLGLTASLRE